MSKEKAFMNSLDGSQINNLLILLNNKISDANKTDFGRVIVGGSSYIIVMKFI